MVAPNEEPKKPSTRKTRAKTDKPRERSLPIPVPTSSAPLALINPDAAGIDVHSDMHMVCVPADRDANPVRQFGANTADLHEIAAWLKKCRVKTVALESTGVYWIPLFELLESEGFQVNLVEPGQLSRSGARPKTDVLDAQWIQRLHSYGLLRASFRPPDTVLALRAYWRQRQMQVRYAAYHVQHMQKAMEQMNVKLTEVVSDITGLTGMSIIDAILKGERNPVRLAKLRDARCHSTEHEIALALEGTWRPEHLFPTEKHFASWLRLSPPQNESNRTKKRFAHRKATNRVATALRLSARVVGKTMTPLGMFYRRIRSRIGGRGAVKATAHKLACLIYRMLMYGEEYVTQSMAEYEAKMQADQLKSLERKAAAMGFRLSPVPSP